jgi:hypothetical protein
MSKGSTRRPGNVPESTLRANWEKVFAGDTLSKPFGFVITNHDGITAPQRRPDMMEQDAINQYRAAYKKAFGISPEGIHILPIMGLAVFLPSEG